MYIQSEEVCVRLIPQAIEFCRLIRPCFMEAAPLVRINETRKYNIKGQHKPLYFSLSLRYQLGVYHLKGIYRPRRR